MKYTPAQKARVKRNEFHSLNFKKKWFPSVEIKDNFFIVESKINEPLFRISINKK